PLRGFCRESFEWPCSPPQWRSDIQSSGNWPCRSPCDRPAPCISATSAPCRHSPDYPPCRQHQRLPFLQDSAGCSPPVETLLRPLLSLHSTSVRSTFPARLFSPRSPDDTSAMRDPLPNYTSQSPPPDTLCWRNRVQGNKLRRPSIG